jgi:hypothetical protein
VADPKLLSKRYSSNSSRETTNHQRPQQALGLKTPALEKTA